MDFVISFIVPALVGVVVGILSGLLGIGGGTILVPVFRLAFGMSPVVSTATSLFTIIPTSVSGAVSHVRHKTCVPSLGVAAGLGGAVTSPLGVWLATISPGWLIMVVAALIIGYSAVKMLGKAVKGKESGKSAPAAAEAGSAAGFASASAPASAPNSVAAAVPASPSAADSAPAPGDPVSASASGGSASTLAPASVSAAPDRQRMTRRQLAIGVAIGLFAGLASGYVGVGGGFIMVPFMLSFVGIAMKQASGTSLIAVAILAVPDVVEQALLGNVQYLAGIAVAVGSIPGAVVGARLVRVVPERQLRFLFGGFLVVAACVLVLNEFGILG